MSEIQKLLRELIPEFADLPDDQIEAIAAIAETREYDADTVLCRPDSKVDGGIVVVSGALEVIVTTPEGEEELAFTARRGTSILLYSLFQPDKPPAGTLRSIEPTRVLQFQAGGLGTIGAASAPAEARMLRYMLEQTTERLELASELYRNALGWSRQISGATMLSWGWMVDSGTEVVMELTSGKDARGRLVQVGGEDEEREFTLRCPDGTYEIIRSRAVARVRFARSAVEDAKAWHAAPELEA